MPLRRFYISLSIALCLFTFFLSPIVAPGHAYGLALASNPITVTSRTYSVHFPYYFDIKARANDATGTIDRASIVIDLSIGGGQELHTAPISKAGHAISVSWREDTSGSHFIPPGTQVDYYWEFWDSAGNTLTDTPQQFSTIDTRFNWQHLTQGTLQVNWYNRPQDFGQFVLNKASSSLQRISATLGGGLIHPINLWVYATDQDFHGSLAPGSYEWVGGEALPSLSEASIVVAGTSDYTLVRDMPHELTHLVFHQLIAQGITAPTWFDEGLAVYNQDYHEPEMAARLQKALYTHTLLRLGNISEEFPADADQAYLAYAQSWNLLAYMYKTFGQPRMAQLIKSMNEPLTDLDEDLQQALGVDLAHLENQWRLSLIQPPILTPNEMTPTPTPTPPVQVKQAQNASTDYTTFWLLIGLGVVLVLVSLTGLILLVFYSVRQNKAVKVMANAPNPVNGQYGNKAVQYQYPDPSTYMRESMYAQPSSLPAPPYQGHEYPIKTPREQAPQE